eukprot:11745283-Ditylum_brightwellii.AAC.1
MSFLLLAQKKPPFGRGGTQALIVSVVTIEEFKKKIVVHLDATAADHAQRLHDLLGQCLHGAAATKWTAMLDQFPVATCTDITFKEAQKAYLEKIVDVSNLGDMLICQLCNSHNNKK